MVETAVPEGGNPPGALVLTKLIEWYRFEVGHEKRFFVIFVTCGSRVAERHNQGTKRKLKSHQAQKKALRAFFGAGGATSIFALCPD